MSDVSETGSPPDNDKGTVSIQLLTCINRCHLIGYQLTSENVNEKNRITGIRYMNVDGMLPFENMVADYVKETGNHVLYRVTPVFEGENLLADKDRGSGVGEDEQEMVNSGTDSKNGQNGADEKTVRSCL